MDDQLQKIFDEDNVDPIILYDEEGEEAAFDQIALIPIEDKNYVILQPLEEEGEEEEEEETLVFLIDEEREELILEEDDDVIDAVYAEYSRLLEEN